MSDMVTTDSIRMYFRLVQTSFLVNQSCIFIVVQVIKSLQDPLEVGNNLPGISDNIRE